MQLANKFLKDYRKMFRLLKSGETFVAFDTETTGLNCETCRIIEIGAVKFNSDGILDTFNTLVNPEQPVPPELVELTHISDDMVKNQPVISKILPDFQNFVKDTIIIAHNAQFDMRFLQAELSRNGFAENKNAVIDTLGFCRFAFPELKKFNQPFMAGYLGIDVSAAHRAYDDAKVCGNIFLHCIKASAAVQK